MASIARFLLLGMICLPFAAHSEMYKCANAEGNMAYQDKPCASPKETQHILTTSSDKEELDPILASIKIASVGYLLERMETWCAAKAPSTLSAVKQARMAWRQRHEPLAEKAAHILQTKLSYDERLNIAAQSKQAQNTIVAKLEEASPADHQQWCAGIPAKILTPQIDLMSHRTLVKTITEYTDH